jgi:GNAT superfamily N-acetyltransferase
MRPTMPTQPNDITIRPARNGDVDAILVMLRDLCEDHVRYDPARFVPPADLRAVYGPWLARAEAGDGMLALVAEAGGTAVGYLVGEAFEAEPKYWAPACGYVHDIYVSADARGAGVSGRLMAAFEEWCRARGLPQVRGITASANARAHAFFRKHGYRAAAVEFAKEL